MANFFDNLFAKKYKDGPGVDRNAPPEKPMKRFFGVLGRKFWYFVRLNFLYVLLTLPVISLAYAVAGYAFQNVEFQSDDVKYALYLTVSVFFICIPIIAFGPVQAGMTRILRDFSQEKPAFIWYDFYQTMKKNFKQSLVVSVINFLLFLVVIGDLMYYSQMDFNPTVDAAVYGFMLFVFIIFLIMQMYIWPMLITFKLTYWQLYKNSFLLAMAKFVPNFMLLLISAAVVYLSFLILNPKVGTVIYFVFLPAFLGFTNVFYSFGVIKKYMIDAPVNPDK